ncbi:MAG: hypothetical protein M3Y72_08790, partial [Acidobacteriota bacterium]|nr:hypothetical protein [Acidobacteriota bacterium]
KPGREGSPHAARTPLASQKRWLASLPSAPPTRGLPPPCASPAGAVLDTAGATTKHQNSE